MDKNRYFQIRSGKYIKTKVADIQRLYSKWLWLVTVVYKPSFADAEMLKHETEDGVIGNGSCYFAEIMDTLSDILRHELPAQSGN